ncbi:MAG: hypothetical protein GTO63_36500, partial [Anaerolineae bacterium]|nr:hypothetical protein [Anaerolineae bacterium]NIQ83037.1 hypothetical protein [Anaerolineae bacterium]
LVDEFVTTFRQYGDDVWGPSRFTHNVYRPSKAGGDPTVVQTVTVTYPPDFQLNVPVTDEELLLEIPAGTQVYDESLDESYIAR